MAYVFRIPDERIVVGGINTLCLNFDYLEFLANSLNDNPLKIALNTYRHSMWWPRNVIQDVPVFVEWHYVGRFFSELKKNDILSEASIIDLHTKYRRYSELMVFELAWKRKNPSSNIFEFPDEVKLVSFQDDLGITNQGIWDVYCDSAGEEYVSYVKNNRICVYNPE